MVYNTCDIWGTMVNDREDVYMSRYVEMDVEYRV